MSQTRPILTRRPMLSAGTDVTAAREESAYLEKYQAVVNG